MDRTKHKKSTVQGLIFHWPDSHGQGELMGLFHPCTLVGTSVQEQGIVPQGSSAPQPVTSRGSAVGSSVLQSQGLLGEQEQLSRNKDHVSCQPPHRSGTGEVRDRCRHPGRAMQAGQFLHRKFRSITHPICSSETADAKMGFTLPKS